MRIKTAFTRALRERLDLRPGPSWAVGHVRADAGVYVMAVFQASTGGFVPGRGGKFRLSLAVSESLLSPKHYGNGYGSYIGPAAVEEYTAIHNRVLSAPMSGVALELLGALAHAEAERMRREWAPKPEGYFRGNPDLWFHYRDSDHVVLWAQFVARHWREAMAGALEDPWARAW
ncbi:MAG: hypothetical protein K1X94_24070 [Sandaracinaceae bacterium]|nr:hypothetical protein [Sandaracinaceae bacterium]